MAFYKEILIIAGIALTIQGCIKESRDNCPTIETITIIVGEKNYANAANTEGETLISEDLPLLSYITPIEAWWYNINTDQTLSSQIPVGATEKTHILDATGITSGNYEIVVTGNQNLTSRNNSDYSLDLHPGGTENADIYIGRTTVSIPNYTPTTISMLRTKGKLTAQFSNIPADVAGIDMQVSGIPTSVDKDMVYSGGAIVKKSFGSIETTDPRLEIMLAPTQQNINSKLTIKINHDNGDITTLSDIDLAIERNKITLIKPQYIPQEDEWIIEMNVDGEWTQIHGFDIRLN